jgi:hypothetical protein
MPVARMSSQHGLSRFPRLRRVRPMPTDLFQEYFKRERSSELQKSPSTDPETPGELTQGSLLRIWLKPPWDDYTGSGSERDSVLLGSTATAEPVLACHRKSYFTKATIRAFQSSGGVTVLQALSSIQHPNIAKLYDVYLYDDRIFVVSEYLELSLAELNYHSFPFEEWEIATVTNEVRRSYEHLAWH